MFQYLIQIILHHNYHQNLIVIYFELVFEGVKEFMKRQKIGVFALSQTGDMFSVPEKKIFRKKVMNTTFYNTKFIYKGRKGVLDNDTCEFVGLMNEGYFTGSLATGLALNPTSSATQKGGLTPTYYQNKLLLYLNLSNPFSFQVDLYLNPLFQHQQ